MSTEVDVETRPDLTVEEVAAKLRCGVGTAKAMLRRGDIRGAKIAGRWLVEQADLDDFRDSKANRRRKRQPSRRASP